MHLFAILWTPALAVRRFPISQALQTQITHLFHKQAEAFLSEKDVIPYSAGRLLDEEEIYALDMELPSAVAQATTSSLGQAVVEFDATAIGQLGGLFVNTHINRQPVVLFQVFARSQILTKEKVTLLAPSVGTGFTKLESPGLTLDSKLSAVYKEGKLLFSSFRTASRLIDLSQYFHEATDIEVQKFRKDGLFALSDVSAFEAACSISRVRKQISMILEAGTLGSLKASKVAAKARGMGLDFVVVEKGKIVLPTDRAKLRGLLDFLQENYYEGCLTDQKYISNSKQLIA